MIEVNAELEKLNQAINEYLKSIETENLSDTTYPNQWVLVVHVSDMDDKFLEEYIIETSNPSIPSHHISGLLYEGLAELERIRYSDD